MNGQEPDNPRVEGALPPDASRLPPEALEPVRGAAHEPPRRAPHDLDRLKWVDPRSPARYIRKEPDRRLGRSNEELLEGLASLADEIFAHLSVFEQFPEAASRGAPPAPENRLDVAGVRARLSRAEEEMWMAYELLDRAREGFVAGQLAGLEIHQGTKALNVHLGAGGHLFDGWLNVDAGGADLALNVNWGLQLPTGCASRVYCAHLLEHLRYRDQAPVLAREMYRILGDGGVLRVVVPDIRKLLRAYVERDQEFFRQRRAAYPVCEGFDDRGVESLDYVLLFCGAGPQILNFNHKFGYDFNSLRRLLEGAGFRDVKQCSYQSSAHPELQVDCHGENASAEYGDGQHFSLFVEAVR